jgi:hypothetical protein
MAGERPLRSRMSPPLDVPSAPPRSSTDSSAMPRPRIAVLSEAVLAPGSPEASLGSGRGSPSVCSTSYLGISQPGRLATPSHVHWDHRRLRGTPTDRTARVHRATRKAVALSAEQIRERQKSRCRSQRQYNRLKDHDSQTTADKRGMHVSTDSQVVQNGDDHEDVGEQKYQKKKPG